MQAQDILARANAFMDTPFFTQIRVVLLQGKQPLNQRLRPKIQIPPAPPPPRPRNLGRFMGKLPESFPLKRCYEAYVRFFDPDA